jgi:putative endopeptidase
MINLKGCKSDYRRSIKGTFTEGSDEQKIGDYYSSFMNRKDRDAKGIAPIQPELKNIDAIANYSDLAAYFGKSNRTGVSMPFSVVVTEDFKTQNSTFNDLARRIRSS